MGDKQRNSFYADNGSTTSDSAWNGSLIRAKTHKLRELVEQYGDLAEEASRTAEVERRLTAEAQIELNAAKRRLKQLETDCEQKHVQLQKVLIQLSDTSKTLEEHECQRRQGEARVQWNEDRITVLETLLRKAQKLFSNAEQRYVDAERKIQLVNVNIERIAGRAVAVEKKNEAIEHELRVKGGQFRTLQSQTEQFLRKERKYEDQIQNLLARVKSANDQTATSMQAATRLHLIINSLEDELEEMRQERYTMEDDMERNMALLNISQPRSPSLLGSF